MSKKVSLLIFITAMGVAGMGYALFTCVLDPMSRSYASGSGSEITTINTELTTSSPLGAMSSSGQILATSSGTVMETVSSTVSGISVHEEVIQKPGFEESIYTIFLVHIDQGIRIIEKELQEKYPDAREYSMAVDMVKNFLKGREE